jgi:ubiquinone/menaquinone biosynthesis C-methylase UbiE
LGFYEDRIVPQLIHLTMRQDRFERYRRRVVAGAEGRVLEVGVGSGLNLPLYPPSVTAVFGLDSSARLLGKARGKRSGLPYSLELLNGSAESIPLEDASVDTVVMSWTLCSIPDAPAALHEVRRVLRGDGQLLFVEHGRSPDI